MKGTEMTIERTEGWLLRWRVVYASGYGFDLQTLHMTKLGARFARLLARA